MSVKTHLPSLAEQPDNPLTNRVIEVIFEDVDKGLSTEALDELLRFCPKINLIQFLNEDEWDNFATEEEMEAMRNAAN
jgi:hypothetical protein